MLEAMHGPQLGEKPQLIFHVEPPLVKSKLVRGVEMNSKQPMEVSFKQFAHYG